jgi:hypothetical protein
LNLQTVIASYLAQDIITAFISYSLDAGMYVKSWCSAFAQFSLSNAIIAFIAVWGAMPLSLHL